MIEWLKLEFTPLEFETATKHKRSWRGLLLEFTPLEFETDIRWISNDQINAIRIYSVGV